MTTYVTVNTKKNPFGIEHYNAIREVQEAGLGLRTYVPEGRRDAEDVVDYMLRRIFLRENYPVITGTDTMPRVIEIPGKPNEQLTERLERAMEYQRQTGYQVIPQADRTLLVTNIAESDLEELLRQEAA